ncbi:MAG TPA: bifunctional hydroxymethylpyrimidine kinase/phosphomethylpyrimidine kinase [Acidobacteriaceae bacterium]|nr:bifunctional hydroxymethylpyrimidine kinase/phosphomethylpyrimidine kinase [Acidobacteriaceae bacterium]
MEKPELCRLLVIGGSDSSGGAGIQADIKTGSALGVDVSTAITAITAQNNLGVQSVEPVPVEMLRAQIASVCSDLRPHAVKLGMLYDAVRVEVLSEAIRKYELRNVVCDPVLVSTSGTILLEPKGGELLLSMLPLFTLFTPNAIEAAALTGIPVNDSADLLATGRVLLDRGANAVLLKGGHLGGGDSTDVLLQASSPEPIFLRSSRIDTRNDHGTGCVLASAIASALAQGTELVDAVTSGCAFVHSALQRSAHLWRGAGRGSMNLLS